MHLFFVFCLVIRACLHEKSMINVYAATENNDYYLNSGKNRDNFEVNVENRDILVFYRNLSGHGTRSLKPGQSRVKWDVLSP